MRTYPAPSPPVVGGTPRYHSGESNHPVKVVVIHSAVIPCEPGRARQLGEWNKSGATKGSWHYATDPAETIQCSYDRFVCHADGWNDHHIAIEMADWPGPWPEGSRTKRWWINLKRVWRWRGKNHQMMLRRTAKLTAQLCLANGLPIKFLSAAALKRGERGVTTHANVTAAYKRSVHWDPGAWPRYRFMRLVRRYAEAIRNEGR